MKRKKAKYPPHRPVVPSKDSTITIVVVPSSSLDNQIAPTPFGPGGWENESVDLTSSSCCCSSSAARAEHSQEFREPSRLANKSMPPRIAHKQSNELYNVPLGVLSHRGTQANGKQTVHCINHMDYWKVKIYFNMIDHNVNSRRPCYSQVYVQPQLLIESHIRCEFTANHVNQTNCGP